MDPDKERFSLLLLEPNEIYFEDFSVDLIDKEIDINPEKIIGRLKICSKSLVFDPKCGKSPLIKIPYKDCENILALPESNNKLRNSYLVVSSLQYIQMLENNILAPYKFVTAKKKFYFYFHYANVNDYILQFCQQLHRASSLHALEQNNMIGKIVFSRHNRVKFNPLWLENIYEEVLYDCKVDEINPLVLNPGRLVLSDSCIYFQPYNNIQPYPVLKIKLSSIISFTKRRFLLRHTGLEIKWQPAKHVYIAFRNVNERNAFCDIAFRQPDLNITVIEPESMTLKWQNGLISNYDYILYLNSLADRTFEDLTQYPIFPWVITDYTSNEIDLNDERIYRDLKNPMGALNPERLNRLKERCDEMGEPKFLYGSHYSAPGLVLFYLVRKFPHLMLCLQNGRFDHPDRMFNKLSDTFRNCLNNMSDFKELIPEFYDITQNGDFLVNIHKIDFGIRSDGTPVNNVALPPWAKNSPELFVKILRKALESDFVSRNLNHWIDLIFGYKQRGEEALKANNLYFHLCYEGSVDLDSIEDSGTRHALEVQISEFGQIPKQLFDKPHVSRNMENSNIEDNSVHINKNCEKLFKFELYASYTGHRDQVTSIFIDDDIIFSTGKDGILKCFNLSQQNQIRSVSFGSLPLGACLKLPNSNVIVVGSWDNTILLYNCDYGKISDIIPAHDDAVSCLNLINELGILISGSWDCSVKVWRGFTNVDYKTFRLSNAMVAYIPLEEKVMCLDSRLSGNSIQIIIGTGSGEVFIWVSDILTLNNIDVAEPKLLVNHENEITCLAFNSLGTKLASCSIDSVLIVTDVMTGMNLFKKLLKYTPLCLTWHNKTDLLAIGDEYGFLSVWNLIEGNLKCNCKISNGPLTCIKFSARDEYVITAGREDREYKIKCWSFT